MNKIPARERISKQLSKAASKRAHGSETRATAVLSIVYSTIRWNLLPNKHANSCFLGLYLQTLQTLNAETLSSNSETVKHIKRIVSNLERYMMN